jgi:hypothetical protein
VSSCCLANVLRSVRPPERARSIPARSKVARICTYTVFLVILAPAALAGKTNWPGMASVSRSASHGSSSSAPSRGRVIVCSWLVSCFSSGVMVSTIEPSSACWRPISDISKPIASDTRKPARAMTTCMARSRRRFQPSNGVLVRRCGASAGKAAKNRTNCSSDKVRPASSRVMWARSMWRMASCAGLGLTFRCS